MTQYFDDKDLKYFILWSSGSILYEETFHRNVIHVHSLIDYLASHFSWVWGDKETGSNMLCNAALLVKQI